MGIPKSKARKLYEAGLLSYPEYLVYREDANFSKGVVTASVLAVMVYAVVMMQFTYLNIVNHASVYPPLEFTTGYFTFWSVEIVMLTSIKKHKIQNKYEKQDSEDVLSEISKRISPGESSKVEPVKTQEVEGQHARLQNGDLP